MSAKRKLVEIADQAEKLLSDPSAQLQQGLQFVPSSGEYESKKGKTFLIEKKKGDALGSALQFRFENVGCTQFPLGKENSVQHRGLGYYRYTKDGEKGIIPKMKLSFSDEHREMLSTVLDGILKAFVNTRAYDPLYSQAYQKWFDLSDGTAVSNATKALRTGLVDYSCMSFESTYEAPVALGCYLDGATETHYQDISLGDKFRVLLLNDKGKKLKSVKEGDVTVYNGKPIELENKDEFCRFCDSQLMSNGSWKASLVIRLTSFRLQMETNASGEQVVFPVFRFKCSSMAVFKQFDYLKNNRDETAQMLDSALDEIMMRSLTAKKSTSKRKAKKGKIEQTQPMTEDEEEEEEEEDACSEGTQ